MFNILKMCAPHPNSSMTLLVNPDRGLFPPNYTPFVGPAWVTVSIVIIGIVFLLLYSGM